MIYYSARLHVVCIVDDPVQIRERAHVCDYPFVLFQAADDQAAFARALELGKEHETEYVNPDGNRVRWRLRAVEFIWKLGMEIDGIEIGSMMDVYQPEKEIDFETCFSPELDVPTISDESQS